MELQRKRVRTCIYIYTLTLQYNLLRDGVVQWKVDTGTRRERERQRASRIEFSQRRGERAARARERERERERESTGTVSKSNCVCTSCMDVPMNDAARSARRSDRGGRRAAREEGASSSSAPTTSDVGRVDAETALLALEKLEVEMKSLIRRASATSNVRNRNRVDSSDEDDTRVRMEMLEKIHLLASIIAAFVSSPHAHPDARDEEDKASTARATRSRKRRVRESIRNVESLITEAEEKLERWEKMLIDMYSKAENVCAPPHQ